MKKIFPLVMLALPFLLVGCGDADPSPEAPLRDELTEKLPGTWETVELEVDYATYMGSDTAYREFIREADWGRVYGVRPPSTKFTPDGKLRRTYRMRSGDVANITNGIWKVTGDSLLVIEPNITYTYGYTLEGDRLELTGTVDQDQDGSADDAFRGVYRLTSSTR